MLQGSNPSVRAVSSTASAAPPLPLRAAAESAWPSSGRVEEEALGVGSIWISEEQYKAYGYPEIDARFKDREWHRRQIELDRTDPRHNPNLIRDQSDPEFWYHAARRPFSKALLRSEQYWEHRRELWIKQLVRVEEMNAKRQETSELLEGCSNEAKRLVVPIMKYSITATVLRNMLEKARHTQRDFRDILEDEESRETLLGIHRRIEAGGEEAAEELLDEYDARWRALAHRKGEEALAAEAARGEDRRVADVQTLAAALNWALKCKKDGMLEWDQGNWSEAEASWRQADETLRRLKAPHKDESSNRMLREVHGAILKNLSQACIRLGSWGDALRSAEAAVELLPEDHKAWFRKACALEGLGRLDEAEACLDVIEECAVGRPDRPRIASEMQARRKRLLSLKAQSEALCGRMAGQALDRGVFADGRVAVAAGEAPAAEGPAPAAAAAPSGGAASLRAEAEEAAGAARLEAPLPADVPEDLSQAPLAGESAAAACVGQPPPRQLTAPAARRLLRELTAAYLETSFQRQVFKLAHDVRMDRTQFLHHLKAVALPLQQPILERWGFAPTLEGAQDMKRAVAEFTTGSKADVKVKACADETTMALFGCMYDVLTLPTSVTASATAAEVVPATGPQGHL